ncbi:MAG: DUF6377 domain-containing protein [Bacteroidales bacterium]
MRVIVLIFLFNLFFSISVKGHHSLDSILNILDQEIAKREFYIKLKNDRIQKLTHKLKSETDKNLKFQLNDSIFHEYIYFRYDSALVYLNRNIEISKEIYPDSITINLNLEKARLHINYGMYWDAAYAFNNINMMNLSQGQRNVYLYNKIRMFYFMNKYLIDPGNAQKYYSYFKINKDRLLNITSDLTTLPWDIQFYFNWDNKNYNAIDKLASNSINLLQKTTAPERLESLIYTWKYESERKKGNIEGQCYYLALGAISNIRYSISNAKSIYLLSKEMLKVRDLQRAQKYINIALENAVTSKSVIDKALICEIVSEINDEYMADSESHRERLIGFLICIFVLSIILILFVILLRKEMRKQKITQNELLINHSEQIILNKRLNDLNKMLAQNNHVKEEYIGIFLGMRPYYIEKMENYRKQIIKYLKSGKIAELHEFCKSSKQEEEENELLYKEFDRMFLGIFPSFIEEFNLLLQEDARIFPKSGEMTIELRIFALIRLGIKDSAQIAKYLRYSVNTIYNYRSRVKNKSVIPRDDFEKRVLKIGT